MSWFKRGSVRQDTRHSSSPDQPVTRDRRNTDPETCLEVFQNHWKQACNVIESKTDGEGCSVDDVVTVIHNFEQMVTLLVSEEGIDGMPGAILHFLLEKDILEKFCSWNVSSKESLEKLKHEQLRLFELVINQSKQLLLIHKPVIRPLMKLLSSCTDSTMVKLQQIEHRTVLVLHQVCVCISQQTVILESFFNTNADHGPARFLIFSLLIPFIHREGPIGQNARDALLLLMAMSAKHPYIGQYMSENSDFCPVLATGLSGLYSSLPRKITPPSESWYMLTEDDIARNPDLQMFLNSLEFCNAVVQIAHPLVKEQLIKFIYNGFLVPVLGPALHQNSREEVMTATAYLDLFLHRITEPVLIKAVLKFILTEKHDEIVILDSLVTRINSSSRLSLVSLSLFKTLINLNCEDVMFQLVFKYLIPCTHVMVSQRRAVKDLDLYSKSAEKFLSLRPACCMSDGTDSPKSTHSSDKTPTSARPNFGRRSSSRSPLISPNSVARPHKSLSDLFRKGGKNKRSNSQLEIAQNSTPESTRKTPATPTTPDIKTEQLEMNYGDYLHEARRSLSRCAKACQHWSAPYNGEIPPPDFFLDRPSSIEEKSENESKQTESRLKSLSHMSSPDSNKSAMAADLNKDSPSTQNVKLLSHGNAIVNSSCSSIEQLQTNTNISDSSRLDNSSQDAAGNVNESDKSISTHASVMDLDECNNLSHNAKLNYTSLSKLFTCLENLDSFVSYLNEMENLSETPSESVEENIQLLDSVLSSLSSSVGDNSVFMDESGRESSHKGDSCAPDTLNVSSFNRPSNTSTPSNLRLKDFSSYVEITMSGLESQSTAQKFLQELQPSRNLSLSLLSSSPTDGLMSPGNRMSDDVSFSMATSPGVAAANRSFNPRYSNSAPNIGPFLSALFAKLESMIQNTLYLNLLLTGIFSRLAAYPHPLLRSFLLNYNLVFQPTVKSLVQVLSSVRQRVDHYSFMVPNFEQLLLSAKRNLIIRGEALQNLTCGDKGWSPTPPNMSPLLPSKATRSSSVSEVPGKEKRRATLTDLLFRRSPAAQKQRSVMFPSGSNKGPQLQRIPVAGGMGYRFINRTEEEGQERPEESRKTWNAVYCALVLEEFLKELAALAQEHAVLSVDEGVWVKSFS